MRGHFEYEFFEMPFGPRFGCGSDFGAFGGFGRRCGPPGFGHFGPWGDGPNRSGESGEENRRGHGCRRHDRLEGRERHCGPQPEEAGCRGEPRGPPPPFCHRSEGPREGRRPCHDCRPSFGPEGPGHHGRQGHHGPGHHGPRHGGPPPYHGFGSHGFGPQSFGPWPHQRSYGPWSRPCPYGRPGRCNSDNSDSEDDGHGRRGRSPCKRGGRCCGGECRGNKRDKRGANKSSGQENEDTVLVQRIVVEAPRCRSV